MDFISIIRARKHVHGNFGLLPVLENKSMVGFNPAVYVDVSTIY
ncbi:hypothetical protein SAMN05192585_11011 [Acetanaerobacterium elongatum]|uniref:Uncharacterized protein n=1 Tax=Acetanaerobacterium elongatum TaxID=258515 RepID=A0A1G9Y476_9FIRM|nr:hypothetical protein SAMN05192585_11011 [Acetanaerobacterium elongatum]